ncbi:hypothetical protein L1987_76138 [Smallanthus sonchifolius]|uniref:Uncharacterized protein n=1 Tax=Smallanthus sonchifolius TaxID=185202 RepID=A0ACB9A7D9_9ASTR|nr:hypothetical protein L1987_76138 [Smallanthus sonchifolius]
MANAMIDGDDNVEAYTVIGIERTSPNSGKKAKLEMGLSEEMEMLEEQKRMIEKLPEMELTQRTKKLRQACFKASYKKRRFDSPN